MSFRHRRGSGWGIPTPKVRRGGQWVALDMPSGGNGGGTDFGPSGWTNHDYLLTGNAPTRSTTVNESDYSGLQAALDSISSDTRLVLDGGTYSGNYDIPHTDNITIYGNGSTISRSDINDGALEYNDTGNEFSTSTDPGGDGTYSQGQSSIEVVDSSIFSVGDEIRIFDDTQVHPDAPTTTSGPDNSQGTYHVVESIDSSNDVLTLEEDLILDWDNPNGDLRIDRVDWGAEDVRVTDLTIQGNDDSRDGSIVMPIQTIKGLWFDNCSMYNGVEGLWVYYSYQIRVSDCYFENLGSTSDPYNAYPCTFQAGTHHVYVLNSESVDSGRYGFQSGSGSSSAWMPTRNGRMENCHVVNASQRGYSQHPGSHHWEYINCTTEGCGMMRARSDGCYIEGGGCDDPGQYPFYDRQAHEARLNVNEQHYVNVSDTNHIYRLLDEYGGTSKYMDWTDVWAEEDGSINQFFNFRCDTGTSVVEVDLVNVAINDIWITGSNWSDHHSFSGDGTVDLTLNSATAPDSQSPSEYFAAEYGW